MNISDFPSENEKTDFDYFQGRVPNKIYISKRFEDKFSKTNERLPPSLRRQKNKKIKK
jgi:hypothetical protein